MLNSNNSASVGGSQTLKASTNVESRAKINQSVSGSLNFTTGDTNSTTNAFAVNTPNYRNFMAAQERATIKLNNYLANNMFFVENANANAANNCPPSGSIASYASAYLQPELKSQLMSAAAAPSTAQASSSTYYNSRSKSVRHLLFYLLLDLAR